MRVTFRWPVRKSSEARVHVAGGAEGKQNVAVMAESTPLEDIETGKKGEACALFQGQGTG